MKKILDDYAPILNMKIVEAEVEEESPKKVVKPKPFNEVSSSSTHTKSEKPISQKK